MDDGSTETELAAANSILQQLIEKKAEREKQYQAEMGRFDDRISRTRGLISALGDDQIGPRQTSPLPIIRGPNKKETTGKAICSIAESSEPEGIFLSEIVVKLNQVKPRPNGEAWTNKQASNECTALRRKKLVWKDDRGRWHLGAGPEN